ncbi:hypothetical protein ACQJBY_050780 [Aegilops geniculata]
MICIWNMDLFFISTGIAPSDMLVSSVFSNCIFFLICCLLFSFAQKIPSRVDLLNIGEAGFTGVRLGEGPPSRVAYKTKTDGWMVFNKQWGVFAAATNLQDGAAALFTFQMSNVNAFDIICVATS